MSLTVQNKFDTSEIGVDNIQPDSSVEESFNEGSVSDKVSWFPCTFQIIVSTISKHSRYCFTIVVLNRFIGQVQENHVQYTK